MDEKVDKCLLRLLVETVIEDTGGPDPIKIHRQITAIVAFSSYLREIGTTNQQMLAADITKANAFSVQI